MGDPESSLGNSGPSFLQKPVQDAFPPYISNIRLYFYNFSSILPSMPLLSQCEVPKVQPG